MNFLRIIFSFICFLFVNFITTEIGEYGIPIIYPLRWKHDILWDEGDPVYRCTLGKIIAEIIISDRLVHVMMRNIIVVACNDKK